jgi:hypothetical protein
MIGDARALVSAAIVVVVVGLMASGAQPHASQSSSGEEFAGVWSGTWEGAGGSGGFELTLEKNKESGMAGRVSVTGQPTYQASFKSLSFDGKKMTAKYDFPPAEADALVVLAATFDGNKASGTWSLKGRRTETRLPGAHGP